MLNKNLIHRRISIFLLLTLYIGFCFEAAAFPPDVMAVGELHELDEGYGIEVVEANVERGEALFVLHKAGRPLDKVLVINGESFSLDDGDIFHFEATLNAAFRSEDVIMVELTDYKWGLRAAAFPPDVMAVGELHELDEGYGIEVVEANVERGEALFVLHKAGRQLDKVFVTNGESFSLDYGDIFHFEATLNAAFRREDAIMVELTDYKWGLRAAASPPDVMAVGKLYELDGGYGIEVVEANVERGEALFVLYKEGRPLSKVFVINGESFSLDDGDIFHFEATLNVAFRSEVAIMVDLTDYKWGLREEPEPLDPIFIISAGTIVLIFIIFARNRLNDRTRQQKIEEYRAKMHKLEKEGYDVSDLKEVLGDEK